MYAPVKKIHPFTADLTIRQVLSCDNVTCKQWES